MKKAFLGIFFCLFFVVTIFSQENKTSSTDEVVNLNWETTYKEALKKSKKYKKPVLIYFTGSDWCGPCKILDKKLFHTQKFKNLVD